MIWRPSVSAYASPWKVKLLSFDGKLGKLKWIDFARGSDNKKKMKSWFRRREGIFWAWWRLERVRKRAMVEWRSIGWKDLGMNEIFIDVVRISKPWRKKKFPLQLTVFCFLKKKKKYFYHFDLVNTSTVIIIIIFLFFLKPYTFMLIRPWHPDLYLAYVKVQKTCSIPTANCKKICNSTT